MKRLFYSFLLVALFPVAAFAQGGVGSDVPVPTLPQYDMGWVNNFFFSMLSWGPIFWAIMLSLAIMLVGNFVSRLMH